MRLLVTGGCGFIGSHFIHHAMSKPVVELLVNVDCLTYAANPHANADLRKDPRYVFSSMNIRDGGGIRGVIRRHRITHLVHMAAESHVDRSISNPEDFIATNINGTFNLLTAVCNPGSTVKRFLHISTDEVYGSVAYGLSDEYSPLNPSSPYSASKAASEMLVLGYAKTYGVPALITRSSNNYGPGQFGEKFIPTVVRSIMKKQEIPIYGDGLNERDWIHVEDNVRAIWEVLVKGKTGSIYNISTNRPITNLALVTAISTLIDYRYSMVIKHVADRPGHDRRYAPDSAKIRAELNWCPLHTFASSLEGVVSSYMLA